MGDCTKKYEVARKPAYHRKWVSRTYKQVTVPGKGTGRMVFLPVHMKKYRERNRNECTREGSIWEGLHVRWARMAEVRSTMALLALNGIWCQVQYQELYSVLI